MQFLFLCNLPKSDASQVCITFLQVTQKILTKDIFRCLEVITEILSFLQIFSVRKTTTQFLNISENLQENRQKTIFLAYLGPLKANYRLFCSYFFFFFFFNYYLAAPRPTSGHYRGDSLTHPMLITAFVHVRPGGHREPRTYIALFLPDSNNCFFMYNTIYPYVSTIFSFCVFIFSFSFILFSLRNTFYNLQ